jgi:hypothetical protein
MEIIDNYLAPDLFNIVQNTILLSQNTPWFMNTDVSGHGVEKHPYFTHLMHHDHRANSNHFDQCIVPILFMFNAKALLRVKVNLYPRTETLYHYHDHYDYDFEHKAAILYLNTNDGYTVIGDEKVESIANRLLRFDATKMHHSTTCTDQQYRANINFNYF